MAGKGGGKSAAHYDARHLAAVLIGLAAVRPGAAPDAVEELGSLPYLECGYAPNPPLPTLQAMLADQLCRIVDAMFSGQRAEATTTGRYRAMEVSFCFKPLRATIVGYHGSRIIYAYATEPGPKWALRRVTILSGDLLVAAAELLADTLTAASVPAGRYHLKRAAR